MIIYWIATDLFLPDLRVTPKPGDTLEVDAPTGRQLVRAGVAEELVPAHADDAEPPPPLPDILNEE